MISRIKGKLLALYTKRLIKTRRTKRTNVGFEQAQTIGILYSGDGAKKQEAVQQLAAQLRGLGKQVTTLCYVPDPKKATRLTGLTMAIQDIQLLGKITDPLTKTFVDTPFDYLYQVDWQGNPVLDYLLAKSQAKCRIGHYAASRAGLFEIMVSLAKKPGGSELVDLTTQMVHYTRLLKT